MPELWPTRRPDGTVKVAARCKVDTAEAFNKLGARVDARVDTFAASKGWQVLPELTRNPYLVHRDSNVVDIVFDGSSQSRRWRDWLVLVVRDLRDDPIAAVSLVGFWDLVSGRYREFRADGTTFVGGD